MGIIVSATRQLTTPPVYPIDRHVESARRLPLSIQDLAGLHSGIEQQKGRGLIPVYFTIPHPFGLDAFIAQGDSLVTTIDATTAVKGQVQYFLDGLVANGILEAYQVDAVISQIETTPFSIDGLVCLPSGVAIFGPGTYTWSPPPGVLHADLFLWGRGAGNASFDFPGWGGPGGGYAFKAHAPFSQGGIYTVDVELYPFSSASLITFDGGNIQCFHAQEQDSLHNQFGGFGINGDVNYTGGLGGTLPVPPPSGFYGAGGGQAAGWWGNGANGSSPTTTSPGAGGGPPTFFGSGGQGGSPHGSGYGTVGIYAGGGQGGYASVTIPPQPNPFGQGLAIIAWEASVCFLTATIGSTGNKNFTLDGLIATGPPASMKSWTLDALTAQQNNRTFTIDGLVAGQKNKTSTLDALIASKSVGVHHTLDALIAAQKSKTVTTDALVAILKSKTATVDALTAALKKLQPTVDAAIASQKSITYTLDADVQPNFLFADDGSTDLFADDNATFLFGF